MPERVLQFLVNLVESGVDVVVIRKQVFLGQLLLEIHDVFKPVVLRVVFAEVIEHLGLLLHMARQFIFAHNRIHGLKHAGLEGVSFGSLSF